MHDKQLGKFYDTTSLDFTKSFNFNMPGKLFSNNHIISTANSCTGIKKLTQGCCTDFYLFNTESPGNGPCYR